MRARKKIIFILLCAAIFSTLSCAKTAAQEKFKEDKVKGMLNTFYTNYITVLSVLDYRKSDSLQRVYCTRRLYDYIKSRFSEQPTGDSYDVFLKSQMFDVRMLEHLNIAKDSVKDDLYHVSIAYGNAEWTINLSVVKQNEECKIDHVFIMGIDEKN